MRILGIDYGDAYVGFSLSDPLKIIASPLSVQKVKSMREAIDSAAQIANLHEVELIVIGLPLMMDGSEGQRASKTRAFGKVLQKVTGISIEYADERLTTVEAQEVLTAAGIKRQDHKKVIDRMAAQLILQSYLDKIKK